MNAEILNQILLEIKEIKADITDIKSEITDIKADQVTMKADITGIKSEITDMKAEITNIKADQVTMKSQIAENTQLLKAIIHRQDEFDAKMDGLTLDLTTTRGEVNSLKETVVWQSGDQASIQEILGEHEVAIRTLRKRAV